MKTFNELSKQELSQLNEMQIDAYIDIELANQNITKPIRSSIDFPDFLSMTDTVPERDMTVYECAGYTFTDLESARKVSDLLSSLPQVRTDYSYDVGSEFRYAKEQEFNNTSVEVKKYYSQAKFEAIKSQLKQLKERNKAQNKDGDVIVDDVINYSAIDDVKYAIRSKVRSAIQFFAEIQTVAKDFDKYLSIVNDEQKAYETLFTVYNIQDEDFKAAVKNLVSINQLTLNGN